MTHTSIAERPDTTPATNSREPHAWRKPRFTSQVVENGYHVKVNVPGVQKSDLKISLEEDVLTLEAKRTDHVPSGWKPLTTEVPTADYRLQLRLQVPIHTEGITANLTNGVLDLFLPLSEAAKPRVIEVQ